MSLIVETGAIVADANTYVTVEEYREYMTLRGYTVSDDDNTVIAYLLQSMDQLNPLNYKGYRISESTQPLPWPRSNVYLNDSRYVEIDTIPDELKYAQMWLAYYIENGTDPSSVPTAGVIREKVDVLEVEYKESQVTSSLGLASMPNVMMNLQYLTATHAGRIGRA